MTLAQWKQIQSMTDRQLVSLWNILQMGSRMLRVSDFATLRKAKQVDVWVEMELTGRKIPHDVGKLIKEAPCRESST